MKNKKLAANAKRLKSLENKFEKNLAHKNLISQSLQSLKNNISLNTVNKSQSILLFDNEDNDYHNQDELEFKITGSITNTGNRFKIDSRFIESQDNKNLYSENIEKDNYLKAIIQIATLETPKSSNKIKLINRYDPTLAQSQIILPLKKSPDILEIPIKNEEAYIKINKDFKNAFASTKNIATNTMAFNFLNHSITENNICNIDESYNKPDPVISQSSLSKLFPISSKEFFYTGENVDDASSPRSTPPPPTKFFQCPFFISQFELDDPESNLMKSVRNFCSPNEWTSDPDVWGVKRSEMSHFLKTKRKRFIRHKKAIANKARYSLTSNWKRR